MRRQTDGWGERLGASLATNPPHFDIDDEVVPDATVSLTRVMDTYRLIAFVSGIRRPTACATSLFSPWHGLPNVWMTIPLSQHLDAAKRDEFNVQVVLLFSSIDRTMNEPRNIDGECRRHFFPSPEDSQLAFAPITWHIANGLVFALDAVVCTPPPSCCWRWCTMHDRRSRCGRPVTSDKQTMAD